MNLLFFSLLVGIPTVSFSAEAAEYVAQEQLFKGAEEGDVAMVEKALAAGASVNAKDSESGYTPLMEAATSGQVEIVKLLLEKKADVHIQDNNGFTALMYTAMGSPSVKKDDDISLVNPENYLAITKLLVDAKADVNKKADNKSTALLLAVGSGNPEIVEFLLKAGANPMVKDESGLTAKTIAEMDGIAEIVKLINDAIAPKLIEEQGGIDLISTEDITQTSPDKLIILGDHLFLKKTIMNHMISKVGSEKGIVDPFTREPIPGNVQKNLLEYFSLPANLLSEDSPIYHDAIELQIREDLIVMMGGSETEEERKELEELEDEAAALRKRIHNTLANYNYNYAD